MHQLRLFSNFLKLKKFEFGDFLKKKKKKLKYVGHIEEFE